MNPERAFVVLKITYFGTPGECVASFDRESEAKMWIEEEKTKPGQRGFDYRYKSVPRNPVCMQAAAMEVEDSPVKKDPFAIFYEK